MGDNWDDEDWENAEIKLPDTAAAKLSIAEGETQGEALLKSVNKPDMSKFADEDAGDDEPEEKYSVPKPQPKKKEEKKWKEIGTVDEPLDDPVAEKERRQRLVEQADYEAARELFGSNLKPLESYLPKSVKDFEDFAAEVVSRAISTHKDSKNYKVLVKALARLACEPLSSEDVKEVEAVVGTVRMDKFKAEKAKVAEKKAPKKSLAGAGKSSSAGLDDFVYDDYDDDADFM